MMMATTTTTTTMMMMKTTTPMMMMTMMMSMMGMKITMMMMMMVMVVGMVMIRMRLCGIFLERKAHCLKIVHDNITDKYSIRNLLQTCTSGKKRKTYRRVSIPACKYGLAPHLWDMPKTREFLEHVVL